MINGTIFYYFAVTVASLTGTQSDFVNVINYDINWAPFDLGFSSELVIQNEHLKYHLHMKQKPVYVS